MSTAAFLPKHAPAQKHPIPASDEAATSVHRLLRALGEDPAREGLRRTPERVARALEFLTSGYRKAARDVLNGAIFHEGYSGVVIVKDIEFYSLCEHHMLPFQGKAHVAYYPDGKVLGLSKLPRLIDVFARRLQVQERLTEQVARAIEEAIEPRGVAVVLEAAHFCMMMRGVEKQHSRTLTSAFRGCFEARADLRQEFLLSVTGTSGGSFAAGAAAGAFASASDSRPRAFPAQYPEFSRPDPPARVRVLHGNGSGPGPRRRKVKSPRGHRCGQCGG